jgi:Fe-S oxidoreductase
MDRRKKGVFSLPKGSYCHLFLYGTDDETKVAFLAAVLGGDIVNVASPVRVQHRMLCGGGGQYGRRRPSGRATKDDHPHPCILLK